MCNPDFIEEIVGYCQYCKNELKSDQPVVISDENKYHYSCFKLLRPFIE